MTSIASQSADQQAHVSTGVTGVEGRSPAQIAWGRLRRDRVAMISLTVIGLYIAGAVFAALISKVLGVDADYHTTLIKDGGIPFSTDPFKSAISWDHLLGLEPTTGRDILAELLYGSRVSLIVAFSGTFFTCVIGVTLGIIAGYSGGFIDRFLGRLMDLILSFPTLLLLIALSPIVIQRLSQTFGWDESGPTVRIVFLVSVFAIFGWPYLARIVRGQVLSLREREFVEAAISIGAGTRRILFKEILPNLWVPILVYASVLLPTYISSEAALAFLGVGVGEPTPTWGKMLADSVKFYQVAPLYLFIPGMALFILVLAFNLLGDSIRDALDPRAGRS